MTEDQIERRLERMIDRIDAMYMAGNLTEAQYHGQIEAAHKAADRDYARVSKQAQPSFGQYVRIAQ